MPLDGLRGFIDHDETIDEAKHQPRPRAGREYRDPSSHGRCSASIPGIVTARRRLDIVANPLHAADPRGLIEDLTIPDKLNDSSARNYGFGFGIDEYRAREPRSQR